MQILFPYTLFNLIFAEVSNMEKTHLKSERENTKTTFSVIVYDINSWTVYQRLITDHRATIRIGE